MSQPSILLFGAGAIGTVYIYILQQAGCDVTAVCRSNYEAAKADGFHIDSKKYGSGLHVHPHVIREVAESASQAYDYIVITAKAFPGSNPTIASQIQPAVNHNTTIILIQNGVGIETEYAALYPNNTILSTVVYLPATQTKPGHVSMGDLELLEIGTYPATTDATHLKRRDTFKDLVQKGNGTGVVYEDVQVKRWSKLLVNAGWNPVCALARARDVDVLSASEEAEVYVKGVMMEVVGIAQALGYKEIDEREADRQLGRAKARMGTKGIEPSMMADALNGRRMEVEAIVGNALRLGREKGVKVERLEGLYVLAKALDQGIGRQKGEST